MIETARARWVVLILAVGMLLGSSAAHGLASEAEPDRPHFDTGQARHTPSWAALRRTLLSGAHDADSTSTASRWPRSGRSDGQPRSARTPTQGPHTDNPVYFVHGYAAGGAVDCAEYWQRAMRKFAERGWRGALRTVGFYADDANCAATIGEDKHVSTDTRITKIAANFAQHIYENDTKRGAPVDIVAHSMGGIIARVALLGTARDWPGFPAGDLRVGNVVTLSTPHGGLHCDLEPACQADQLQEQSPGSRLIDVLHASANQLNRPWTRDTNWYFIGADEDRVVSGDSAVHEGFPADGKYRYLRGGAAPVTHERVHTVDRGAFRVRAWRPGEPARVVRRAPAPLELAYGGVAGATAPPDGWASFTALRGPMSDRHELS